MTRKVNYYAGISLLFLAGALAGWTSSLKPPDQAVPMLTWCWPFLLFAGIMCIWGLLHPGRKGIGKKTA